MSISQPVSRAPSLLSRAAWVPATTLFLATLITWAIFLAGRGMSSIGAWIVLLLGLPLVGVVGLVAGSVVGLVRWRRSRPAGTSAVGLRGPLGATLLASLAALAAFPWNFGFATMAFPYRLANAAPVATVRLPAAAALRVIWGGDTLAHNRHAMVPDQRWAYDLAVDPVLVGSARLEDYGCWGVEVVSPVAGRVHLAHDGEIDLTPGQPGLPLRPLGNHVVLALPTGTFLLLAHLQKDSVKVREGEIVREGQALGRCGNSGNTSEPHIHIHHQRQDPRGRPINVSEGLPLFFRDHEGAPMPEGGVTMEAGRAVATGALVRHLGAAASP